MNELCGRCEENGAALRVSVTDLEGLVLHADAVCLECISFDKHGNIEVDFTIGTRALKEAQLRSETSGKEKQ